MIWLIPLGIGAWLFYPSSTSKAAGVVSATVRKVFGPFVPDNIPRDRLSVAARPILALIAEKESGGDYNVVYGGRRYGLTTMTISQVYNLQNEMVRTNRVSSAVGRYQIIKKTLKAIVSQMNINPSATLFSEATQDKLAIQLLINRGFERLLNGRMSVSAFARALSMEWASMPKDASNKTFYNDGINRALTSYQTVLAAIDRSKSAYGVA